MFTNFERFLITKTKNIGGIVPLKNKLYMAYTLL